VKLGGQLGEASARTSRSKIAGGGTRGQLVGGTVEVQVADDLGWLSLTSNSASCAGTQDSLQNLAASGPQLMLPESQHLPPVLLKHSPNFRVSSFIFLDFIRPENPICRRNATTAVTPMPEATVQENREPRSRENYIRATR
jgi:hypothetical protein